MIKSITSTPTSRKYINEATIFAKEEMTKAAEIAKEAISKDKEKINQTIIDYKAQFIPVINHVNLPEDAVKSYAISHSNIQNILETSKTKS